MIQTRVARRHDWRETTPRKFNFLRRGRRKKFTRQEKSCEKKLQIVTAGKKGKLRKRQEEEVGKGFCCCCFYSFPSSECYVNFKSVTSVFALLRRNVELGEKAAEMSVCRLNYQSAHGTTRMRSSMTRMPNHPRLCQIRLSLILLYFSFFFSPWAPPFLRVPLAWQFSVCLACKFSYFRD